MKNKIKLLIATAELGQFRYYEEVASRLKKQGYDIAYCCDRDDPGVPERIRQSAIDHGFGFYLHGGNQEPGELNPTGWLKKFLNRVKKANISKSELTDHDISLSTLEIFRKYHSYRLQEARRIIHAYNPDIIITGEDGIASNYWLFSIAKEKKCRVVTLPYGLANSTYLILKGVEEQHTRKQLRTTSKKSVQLIKKYYPQWVKHTKYGEVIYLPEEFILAVEDLNIKIKEPWCFQGGLSDLILIENEFMIKRYLAEGISIQKIKKTGSIYCDIMYEVFQSNQALSKAYDNFQKVNEDTTTVLILLPASDHEGWGHLCPFDSVASYVKAIQQYFSHYKNVKLRYSFHPKMSLSDRKDIEALGIHDYNRIPVYIIPECDILIISSSSLARWALAARKLVINFDIYNFGINNFPEIPAYCQVADFDDFKTLVHKAISEASWYQSIIEDSKPYTDLLGPIDGTAIVKIDQQLKQLLTGRKFLRFPEKV